MRDGGGARAASSGGRGNGGFDPRVQHVNRRRQRVEQVGGQREVVCKLLQILLHLAQGVGHHVEEVLKGFLRGSGALLVEMRGAAARVSQPPA